MQKTASSLEWDNDDDCDDDDEEEDNDGNNNNNSPSYNLLSACYVPAPLLSTLYLVFQWIFHQPCEVYISIISIV